MCKGFFFLSSLPGCSLPERDCFILFTYLELKTSNVHSEILTADQSLKAIKAEALGIMIDTVTVNSKTHGIFNHLGEKKEGIISCCLGKYKGDDQKGLNRHIG